MAVGLAPFLSRDMGAGLRRGADIGLGLDRPGATENLPMILAGLQSESRRQCDHFRALGREGLKQIRKPYVVTDRAADDHILAAVGHDRAARGENRAFVIFSAVWSGDVEHMDLVVA